MAEEEEKKRRKIDDLDERSDQVKEILGQAPNWVIQWGISVVFFIVVGIIVGSMYISYPDIIPARITITSKNPPIYLAAQASGKLDQVFVKAGDSIPKDGILAVIENTANFDDVALVKKKINEFQPSINDFDSLRIKFPSSLKLGTIQAVYHNFRTQYQQYLNYNKLNPEKQQASSLRLQLSTLRRNLRNSRNQLEYYKTELDNAQRNYRRYETLYNNNSGSISEREFLDQQSVYFAAKRNYESLESAISRDENTILTIESQLSQATIGDKGSALSTDQNLEEAKQNLQNQILQWEQQFVLKSPIDGQVTLFDKWNIYQNVTAGEVLFTVIPHNIEGIIGNVTMPVQNSGKVKEGQTVIIKIDNYPYQEWGSLEGKIQSISAVPKQNVQGMAMAASAPSTYTIFIDVESLTSSFEKELDFKQEMQGSAEIVVEELTVFQRIFYQLREVLSKR